MIRIKTPQTTIDRIAQKHFKAVLSYVKNKNVEYQKGVYLAVRELAGIQQYKSITFEQMTKADDWEWLKIFILADVDSLRLWVKNQEKKLQFDCFKKIYKYAFSNGTTKYVDKEKTYNAYVYLKEMNVMVCPYCEDEYLDLLWDETGKNVRTCEIDHFFPKKEFPGLAMCFYNLIPSGQNCNGIKDTLLIGASPYDADIENMTRIYPDLPVGINMENVKPEDCKPKFHAKGNMLLNKKVFLLEQRYERHSDEAYQILKTIQQFPIEKMEEMVRLGFFHNLDEAIEHFHGSHDDVINNKLLRQKMKRDLNGYANKKFWIEFYNRQLLENTIKPIPLYHE